MCCTGVCQGGNLSPLLFILFLNDFTQHMRKVYHGLNITGTCYLSLKDCLIEDFWLPCAYDTEHTLSYIIYTIICTLFTRNE